MQNKQVNMRAGSSVACRKNDFFNEEVFRRLIENFSGASVAVFDEKLRIIIAGGRAFEDLGSDPRRLQGLAVTDAFDADTAAVLLPAYKAALDGKKMSFELSYKEKDFTITVIPLSSNNRIYGGISISQELTRPRLRYGKYLNAVLGPKPNGSAEKCQRILHSSFEAISDIILVLDRELSVVMSNRRQVENKTVKCYTLLRNRKEPCTDCPALKVFASGEKLTLEMPSLEGKMCHKVHLHPIYNDRGEVEMVVEHAKDISMQKRSEESLKRLNETLESRVKERMEKHEKTIASLEREIDRRRRGEESIKKLVHRLETVNRELESFSYSVSHDLQAPLRHVKGYIDILKENFALQKEDDYLWYFARIEESIGKLQGIIESLLTLSRINRRQLCYNRVDLSKLFSNMAEELQKEEPERVVEFEVQPAASAWGDPELLSLVLQNLLNNAWKYSSRNTATRIGFGVIRRDGRKIFFVSDNGVGFDMDSAKNLFQPFSRLHSAADFPGTGIGLATVQRIIRRHGGKIWAVGRVGKGATFYFTIFPGGKTEWNDE
jgi:signal transduction histidine kinase